MPDCSIYSAHEFYAPNNIIIRDDSCKSVDELIAKVGDQLICFGLAEPYTIQLTPQQLYTLRGINNVWSSTGATTLSYIADTKSYIDNKLAAIAAATL